MSNTLGTLSDPKQMMYCSYSTSSFGFCWVSLVALLVRLLMTIPAEALVDTQSGEKHRTCDCNC